MLKAFNCANSNNRRWAVNKYYNRWLTAFNAIIACGDDRAKQSG